MAGYHWLEGMAWIDAFANAAMILSGMGPLQTWGGKLFAGLYAFCAASNRGCAGPSLAVNAIRRPRQQEGTD